MVCPGHILTVTGLRRRFVAVFFPDCEPLVLTSTVRASGSRPGQSAYSLPEGRASVAGLRTVARVLGPPGNLPSGVFAVGTRVACCLVWLGRRRPGGVSEEPEKSDPCGRSHRRNRPSLRDPVCGSTLEGRLQNEQAPPAGTGGACLNVVEAASVVAATDLMREVGSLRPIVMPSCSKVNPARRLGWGCV